MKARLEKLRLNTVLAAARGAIEARGIERAHSVTVIDLSPGERRALANVCGWREVPSGPRVKVPLKELDGALRESALGVGLAEAIEGLFGPMVDRRAARAGAVAARDAIWSRARERIGESPTLQAWLDDLRAHGRVARAATLVGSSEQAVLDDTIAVVLKLPAAGTLLPVFALEVLGDTHALDAGRPLSSLVLRGAAALTGALPPANAVQRRRVWADVGVACDSLSADVLTLGLCPLGSCMLSRHLREASEQGEPRRITLRELGSTTLFVAKGTVVFVCENPSVVAAAADRLAAKTQPLVCVEGVPSTAAVRLLKDLSASGATLRFHVDFDWGGVRIANVLMEHVPDAKPWRLSATDYERSVTEARAALELVGSPLDAVWDSEVRATMSRFSVVVSEEQVLDDLLHDLAKLV